MERVYEIELKLSSAASITPPFSIVQGDTGTRKIKAKILNDDGTAFSPDSGTTVEYWSAKPDRTGTQHSASISSNVVTVTLTEQDTAAAGMIYAAIVLKKSGQTMAAMPFYFKCERIPTGANVKSTNDYQTITDATGAANAAADNANEAASHAPMIRSSDLHWMTWDIDTGEYVDTGVPASGIDGSVLYSAVQTLTDAQSKQARSNIGAASDSDFTQLIADLKAGTEATADYHLGFYKDADGYVCQKDD